MTKTQDTPFAIRAEKFAALGIKGLRITPEYFAQRIAQRRAYYASRFCEEVRETDGGAVLYVSQKLQNLYNDDPDEKCTCTMRNGKKFINRSLTNSYESVANGVRKEAAILEKYGRKPMKEIVWCLYNEYLPKDLNELRCGVFRYLKEHDIEAIVAIELTYGKDEKPNNRVHYHILTDDPRSLKELEKLIEKPCKRRKLIRNKNYGIRSRELPDGFGYIGYYTKRTRIDKDWCEQHGKRRVILFAKNTGIRKFYQIGKWYKDENGKKTSKKKIWKAFIEERYKTKSEQKSTINDSDDEQ